MKKIMIMAAMMLSVSAAFAGDSEPLKAILKATTYEQAKTLLDQNLSQLANNGEKAKAYNKLVDLALDKFNKESQIEAQNQVNTQLKQEDKNKAFDTLGMYNAAYNALQAGLECDKYDRMPNAKGKIKPAFTGNGQKLQNPRVQLVNAGQLAAQKGDNAGLLKYWGTFLDTEDAPLFEKVDKANEKGYFGQVARFASAYALEAKDYAACERYADMAMRDTAEVKNATTLKLASMQAQLKTHEDSTKFVTKLETMYQKDKQNDAVFQLLTNMYSNMDSMDKLNALLDAKEKEDPNNFFVFAYRGQNAMFANDYEKAVPNLKRAVEIQPKNAQIITMLGTCLFNRALAAEDHAAGKSGYVPAAAKAQITPVFQEAAKYLEMARDIDPDHVQANWPVPLYRTYYKLYGDKDARTIELAKITGQN